MVLVWLCSYGCLLIGRVSFIICTNLCLNPSTWGSIGSKKWVWNLWDNNYDVQYFELKTTSWGIAELSAFYVGKCAKAFGERTPEIELSPSTIWGPINTWFLRYGIIVHDYIINRLYNCIVNWNGDILPKLVNHPMMGLLQCSMSLNCIMHIQKWDFGGCVISKVHRIRMKFSKMKTKTFSNDLCEHLPIAIFIYIIASFITESDLSTYGLGQNSVGWKMKGVGALITITMHALMELNQENTCQRKKTR